MTLPDGVKVRPHGMQDVHASFRLFALSELHDLGEVEVEEEDVASEFRKPSFDASRDTIGVWSGSALVADAYLLRRTRADVAVDPAWRGRGIGTWLREWTEGRAREIGANQIGQMIADARADAVRLLTNAGYTPRSRAWILRIDHTEEPVLFEPPEGIAIRPFQPTRDDHAAYRVIEEAFSELSNRHPQSFQDWAETTIRRADFDPERFLLAAEGGDVIGAALGFSFEGEGWIEQLAVRRSHRGRGIARALLHRSFRQAWDRGERTSGLSTNSDTGALTLYEKVGMHVRRSYTNYALDL